LEPLCGVGLPILNPLEVLCKFSIASAPLGTLTLASHRRGRFRAVFLRASRSCCHVRLSFEVDVMSVFGGSQSHIKRISAQVLQVSHTGRLLQDKQLLWQPTGLRSLTCPIWLRRHAQASEVEDRFTWSAGASSCASFVASGSSSSSTSVELTTQSHHNRCQGAHAFVTVDSPLESKAVLYSTRSCEVEVLVVVNNQPSRVVVIIVA
jgi:hypothetical protein